MTGPFLTLRERRVLALVLALLALGYGLDGWRRLQAPELPVPSDSLDAAFFRMGARLAAEPPPPAAPAGPLDLNAATRGQLEALPGIGPSRAQAILDLRRSRGRFDAVEDLLTVRGIGPATLDRLRPLLIAEAAPSGDADSAAAAKR